MSSIAVDHVRIEPTGTTRFECADPRDGLAAKLIDERKVLDRERDVSSCFGKHDPAPAADAEERLRVEAALPDLLHHAAPDRCDPVGAGETESPLNLWMQPVEVGTEDTLID